LGNLSAQFRMTCMSSSTVASRPNAASKRFHTNPTPISMLQGLGTLGVSACAMQTFSLGVVPMYLLHTAALLCVLWMCSLSG
jgi:hypothetical protein